MSDLTPLPLPETLLRGLRQFFHTPDLRVTVHSRQRLAGGLSGSTLERWRLHLQGPAPLSELELVYKRGVVVPGAFLQGAPQREAWLYQQLRPHIPLTLPTVIAVVPAQGDIWMLPFADSKPTSHWSAAWNRDDVAQSLVDLARLHAHFWERTESLEQQSWLAQPTGRDALTLLEDAQKGLQQIIAASAYDEALTPGRVQKLLTLARHPRPLLALLQATPFTLLHGDAGFQNIAIAAGGEPRIWFDWQLVGIGPAVLDLVTFLHPWAYPQAHPPLSFAEMVSSYLNALQAEGVSLEKTLFVHQVDAALLLRWLSQWAPLLGKYRARLREDIRAKLYHAFAQLQWPALARWK